MRPNNLVNQRGVLRFDLLACVHFEMLLRTLRDCKERTLREGRMAGKTL